MSNLEATVLRFLLTKVFKYDFASVSVFNFVYLKYNLYDHILGLFHCFLLFLSAICSYVVLGVEK